DDDGDSSNSDFQRSTHCHGRPSSSFKHCRLGVPRWLLFFAENHLNAQIGNETSRLRYVVDTRTRGGEKLELGAERVAQPEVKDYVGVAQEFLAKGAYLRHQLQVIRYLNRAKDTDNPFVRLRTEVLVPDLPNQLELAEIAGHLEGQEQVWPGF